MRREWIEIHLKCMPGFTVRGSPSMRREWIEMLLVKVKEVQEKSPSMRREWIEMA